MPKMQKKQSKRKACSLRYKIIKRAAEHNRKLRRALKNKSKKKPKDPGVPNSAPFKEEILKEAENRKQRVKDWKQAQKDSRLKQRLENRGLSDLIKNINKKSDKFKKDDEQDADGNSMEASTNFKSYYKELKKVIEDADVILEVLDARDPLGSRCPQLEEMVINSKKRLVLVLNKIDLIPRSNLEAWLTYLRKELPTVAFKSSTQTQSNNLSQCHAFSAIHINESLQASRRCVGAPFLMKVLGNYCRNENIQTSIKVGVVGFPNVGKNSVINSLKRSRSCTESATPGVTKSIQEVALDNIKILDSPGVVFAKDGSSTTLALRNAVKIDTLSDVITPAAAIVQRADHQQLCMHYCVPEFSSVHELLCFLAKRMGMFKKGGMPNVDISARKLINDWNSGKIKYYTHPPEEYKQSFHVSAEYVAEMGKAFEMSSMEESLELDMIPEIFPSQGVEAKSVDPTEGLMCDVNDEDIDIIPNQGVEAKSVDPTEVLMCDVNDEDIDIIPSQGVEAKSVDPTEGVMCNVNNEDIDKNEAEDIFDILVKNEMGVNSEEEFEDIIKTAKDSNLHIAIISKIKPANKKDDYCTDKIISDELRKSRKTKTKTKKMGKRMNRRKMKNEKKAKKLSAKMEKVLSVE